MRTGKGSPERERAALVHVPFSAVAARIEQFQHDLVNRQLGPDETERLTRLQNRLSLTLYVEDSLRGLTVSSEFVSPGSRLAGVVSSFVEALDFVLLTLVDALEAGGGDAVETLIEITGDRGDLMERIRQNFLTDEGGIAAADRAVLLQATSVFERVIWMTQRLARLIGGGAKELS
jgi:phosphate:Na+ symporter